MAQKRGSLNESFKALVATVQALYKIAPFVVVTGVLLATFVVWVTLHWSPLMIGTASLVVLAVSLGIFTSRGNFGEAMLSLAGGLLTIFAFEWTPGRYIAFMVVWLGFALAAFLISCVKIAAKSEDIYRTAALRVASTVHESGIVEERLRGIGDSSEIEMLGPIERAEIIRVMAFRNLPIDLFFPCLKGVETLSVITKCDIKVIAIFLADFVISLGSENASDASAWVDKLYDSMRESPVPPEEYFAAFESSRRLLVSRSIDPIEFLDKLTKSLADGYAPAEILEAMSRRLDVKPD